MSWKKIAFSYKIPPFPGFTAICNTAELLAQTSPKIVYFKNCINHLRELPLRTSIYSNPTIPINTDSITMCVADNVFHIACGHNSVHLLMACHAPKYPYPFSHHDLCPAPKLRKWISVPGESYECLVCSKQKADTIAPKATPAVSVVAKSDGSNKENVKL